MKLEQQVSSLELSKTLKNLGVRQESAFYWAEPFPLVSSELRLISKEVREKWSKGNGGGAIHFEQEAINALMNHIHAAFTVAELYKIHCDLDPHACYRFPEGIEPEHLADHLAEEICQLLKK